VHPDISHLLDSHTTQLYLNVKNHHHHFRIFSVLSRHSISSLSTSAIKQVKVIRRALQKQPTIITELAFFCKARLITVTQIT